MRGQSKTSLSWVATLVLVLLLAFPFGVLASSVDEAIVDTTAPSGSVTLAPGGSGTININLTVTGNQIGTATFDVYRNWTLSGGAFTGSNPQTFSVSPRSAQDSPTTFSTSGTLTVATGQEDGTFNLVVGPFNVTNSNTSGAKLSNTPGSLSNYQVTVTAPPSLPANSAPTVAATNATVTVNEGQTAGNAGTYSDANAGDNVSISASVGNVSKTGANSGAWSWSLATTDGPAQSQTVTITANDGNGGIATTTFGLTVNNVPPTLSSLAISNGSAVACTSGNDVALSFSFSDPGSADTFTGSINWGDGSANTSFSTSPVSTSHHYGAGSYTITVNVSDDDGGTAAPKTGAVALLYNSSGILQPINADGTSSFKIGSTIPVKIRITDCSGASVSTLGPRVNLQKVSDGDGAVNEVVSSSAADTGNTMRYDSTNQQYIFNLSTKKSQFNAGQDLTSGTYKLTVTDSSLADVVTYFKLRS